VIDATVAALVPVLGVKPACALTGRSRATHYRAQRPPTFGPRPRRAAPPNAMTDLEREAVLGLLRSAQYC
jgi:putative transposase